MAGAVGEMASVKRHKLWKMGEDGLCCSSSAIQTRLGPLSLLEERSKTPLFLLYLCVVDYPPKLGETVKVYRIPNTKAMLKFIKLSLMIQQLSLPFSILNMYYIYIGVNMKNFFFFFFFVK